MIEPVLEDVKQYVYEQEGIEACGLLNIERGRVKWHPCTNKAEQPWIDFMICLLYTSPSPRDQRGSRMPSSA